ncbi:hypothetical protein D3C78_1653900 [compost metagenome]
MQIVGFFDVVHFFTVVNERSDTDIATVALEATVAAENTGFAIFQPGKGGHGEGGGAATGKLHIDHLVIDHVIVAAVDAAAILTVAQRRLQV